MTRSQPFLGAFALSCAGPITLCAAASPAPTSVETRFEFSSSGCGSADEFMAKVQRRSSRIRLVAGGGAGGRALLVEIRSPDAAGTLVGAVKVIDVDGATRSRRLKASSCEEAMEGLSLIATVTLDPEAMMAEPETDASLSPEPATTATSPAPSKTEPAPRRDPSRPPPPASSRVNYRVSVGVLGAAWFLAAPQPAFGGAVSASFELNPGALLSPLWRLSLVHAQARGIPKPVGDAHFAFTVPILDVCPVRLGSAAVGVRPCAYAGLGSLEVWGTGAFRDEEHVRTTGSAGGALLAGWRIGEVFEIIADGRAGHHFSRDEFGFDRVAFYRTRSLVFSAGAGLAGGFP